MLKPQQQRNRNDLVIAHSAYLEQDLPINIGIKREQVALANFNGIQFDRPATSHISIQQKRVVTPIQQQPGRLSHNNNKQFGAQSVTRAKTNNFIGNSANSFNGSQTNPLTPPLILGTNKIISNFSSSNFDMGSLNGLPVIQKKSLNEKLPMNISSYNNLSVSNNLGNPLPVHSVSASINHKHQLNFSLNSFQQNQSINFNNNLPTGGNLTSASAATTGTSWNTNGFNSDFAYLKNILKTEKDERYRYLAQNGTVRKIQDKGNIIFAELPQIEGILVCYRRPVVRDQSIEKLNLDKLQLTHIPLLEGQEKLKILTFQHNQIGSIQNLVSLPHLLYLDLHDNMVKDIQNLNSLPQLRVLLIPKNQISQIQNLESLTKLEVLDMHSNQILKIQGISKLVNLRVLNLANNSITQIENIETLTNLTELNMQINLIENFENVLHLQKLNQLSLANNKVQNLENLKLLDNLPQLKEINLQGNPVTRNQLLYFKVLLGLNKQIEIIDHKSFEILQVECENLVQNNQIVEEVGKQVVNNSSIFRAPHYFPGNDIENASTQVLKIIGEQWNQEVERVQKLENRQLFGTIKRDILKQSLVEGGHAEIEDEISLLIYGNAYEVVLQNQQFQEKIERVLLQYILLDALLEPVYFNILKSFIKIREITLKHNHITSLLQLAKIEVFPNLKIINIENNPICSYNYLQQFIIYRFPGVIRVNGQDVKQMDRTRAKQIFNNFDRILQLPEKFYNSYQMRVFQTEIEYANVQKENVQSFQQDKNYLKILNKTITDVTDQFAKNVVQTSIDEYHLQQLVTICINDYALDILPNIMDSKS